ncbi:MAG: aminotransferase class I/II-fold pyridoxal phosphate-dependent enzyme [Caenibius sp.]
MGQHPKVIAAMEEAYDVGAGSGGTCNIGGNTHYHVESADWPTCMASDGALLFTSGYVSNDANSFDAGQDPARLHHLSDELNHASMIAGTRNSGCEKRVWRHNDTDHSGSCWPPKIPTCLRL